MTNRLLIAHISSNEKNKLLKALSFSANQFVHGTPVLVYLDDQAVQIASKKNEQIYADEQKILAKLVTDGANITVCPFSMKLHGVNADDIISGIKLGGDLEAFNQVLFDPGTKVISW